MGSCTQVKGGPKSNEELWNVLGDILEKRRPTSGDMDVQKEKKLLQGIRDETVFVTRSYDTGVEPTFKFEKIKHIWGKPEFRAYAFVRDAWKEIPPVSANMSSGSNMRPSDLYDYSLLLMLKCEPQKPCPEDMVFVQGGTYTEFNTTIPDLCVDQHEFTHSDAVRVAERVLSEVPDAQKNSKNASTGHSVKQESTVLASTSRKGFNDAQQPKVGVSGPEAKQWCEAQGKRLAEPLEWAYIASQNGTKRYSTKTGELDEGVQYKGKTPGEVCAAKGYYIEYGGKEICDMSGNVWEWTYSPSTLGYGFQVNGGACNNGDSWGLEANYIGAMSFNTHSTNIGFRCVLDL